MNITVYRYLDFINVMAYDLHGSYDGVTGHNAPLYASSIDTTDAAKLLNVVCIYLLFYSLVGFYTYLYNL